MKCICGIVCLLAVAHASSFLEPFEVDIKEGEHIICRGVIVSAKVVLTNWRCIREHEAKDLQVAFIDDVEPGEVISVVPNPDIGGNEEFNELAVLVLRLPHYDYIQEEDIDYDGTESLDCEVNWHTDFAPTMNRLLNIWHFTLNTGSMTLTFPDSVNGCNEFVRSLSERGAPVGCSDKLTGILATIRNHDNSETCHTAVPIFTRLTDENQFFVKSQILASNGDPLPEIEGRSRFNKATNSGVPVSIASLEMAFVLACYVLFVYI